MIGGPGLSGFPGALIEVGKMQSLMNGGAP